MVLLNKSDCKRFELALQVSRYLLQTYVPKGNQKFLRSDE